MPKLPQQPQHPLRVEMDGMFWKTKAWLDGAEIHPSRILVDFDPANNRTTLSLVFQDDEGCRVTLDGMLVDRDHDPLCQAGTKGG